MPVIRGSLERGRALGVQPCNGRWKAVVEVQGVPHVIGAFDCVEHAAAAYDIEALRLWGADAELNFSYDVREEADGRLRCTSASRDERSFTIARCADLESYAPLAPDDRVFPKHDFEPSIRPLSEAARTFKYEQHRHWPEKQHSLWLNQPPFTFEVTFPAPGSLGLNLTTLECTQGLCAATASKFGALCVVDAQGAIGSVIKTGDLILSINQKQIAGPGFAFLAAKDAVANEPPPRTLRFFRCSSPSPAELSVAIHEMPVAAKFLIQTNGQIQLTYVDTALPATTRRALMGQQAPVLQPLPVPSHALPPKDSIPAALRAKLPRKPASSKGVFYDRGRWVVQVECNGRQVFLGRFSDEQEAVRVCNQAQEEIRQHGNCSKRQKVTAHDQYVAASAPPPPEAAQGTAQGSAPVSSHGAQLEGSESNQGNDTVDPLLTNARSMLGVFPDTHR